MVGWCLDEIDDADDDNADKDDDDGDDSNNDGHNSDAAEGDDDDVIIWVLKLRVGCILTCTAAWSTVPSSDWRQS